MPRGRPRIKKEEIKENPLVEQNNIQINTERKDRLNSILREINKIEGIKISYASDLEARTRLSFGYKYLDNLTGGGIPVGSYTTIWGSKGVGKSTIAYKIIATAQKQGKIAAYIDMERSYDESWAKKFNVDTTNLVYCGTETAEQALDFVIKVCREKVVDLIVLDSIQGLSPHGEQYEGKADKEKSVEDDTMALLARKLSQFFRMATPYVAQAKCAVVLIGQARMDLGSFIKMETLSGGHALLHNSRLILRCRKGQGSDAPSIKKENEEGKKETIKTGFDLVIKVDKAQLEGCIEGTEIHVPFLYTKGIEE